MLADKLLDELIRDEGLRLKPYTDTRGKTTIGIGRNLTDVGITNGEAYKLAHNDIENAVGLLDEHLTWWRGLSEIRQRVLANMTFNMGLSPNAPPGKRGLAEFKRTLTMIAAGDFDGAATEMLVSDWAKQVGPRAIRLSDMMRRGV